MTRSSGKDAATQTYEARAVSEDLWVYASLASTVEFVDGTIVHEGVINENGGDERVSLYNRREINKYIH